MANLNPWKETTFRLTYGEAESACMAMRGFLDGAYPVGSNIVTRSLNKARAVVKLDQFERELQANPLGPDSAKLIATMRLNPAGQRFFRNTVNAAVAHYAAEPMAETLAGNADLQEQVNVLRGLQLVFTKPT